MIVTKTAAEVSRMVRMIGSTEQKVKDQVESVWNSEKQFGDKDKRTVATEMAISILSDAQELLSDGEAEGANRAINRAKWILMEFVTENNR